jgi:glycosyltransferase involved in cell wall biosynthesis
MSSQSGTSNIILDLRCLQDPNYARRGVGHHALALLQHAPRRLGLIGLTDPSLPALLPEARDAIRSVHVNAYAAAAAGRSAGFIMMSPMTHDPIFCARLMADPSLLRAAIVYDFIPWQIPQRYLPGPTEKLGYAVALRWLARSDLFLPISRSTADNLIALLGVTENDIAVTGCPIDPAFEQLPSASARAIPRHLLLVGGGDPRKNPEVVIRAHARSPTMQTRGGIPLVVGGGYSSEDAKAFRALAAANGGRPELIEVPGHIPESGLIDLYGRALAFICSSHDEGFSIPVVEAMAAGIPCLVSDIPAHAELVSDPDCRFSADDDGALRPKLERAVGNENWRAAVLARQAGVWPGFRAQTVAARFWDAVLRRLDRPAPVVLRGRRPRVALLSPLPPERSGVADYTAATCTELGRLVDLHVFTDTAHPRPLCNVASVRPLGALPHLNTGFDRVISVVGNSHFHLRIFEMLLRYGAACIAHDARMLGFYRILLGQERALAVASKELRRPVTEAELNEWLGDEGKLKALFLGEIAESAVPTIVHSPVTARMFAESYGVAPYYLPFSVYRPWTTEELVPARRATARARLGLEPGEVAIATFGIVHENKAPEECVWALEVLRSWGIQASLHFVGAFNTHSRAAAGLLPLIARLGLQRHVRLVEDFVSEQTYRDYLVGADLAVQLRTYGLGGLSGALLDCGAAGLPSVTNVSLAAAVGVPDYVRSIPDGISPLLLAEALANLRDAGLTTERPEAARRAYSEQRSLVSYARGLCQALALEMQSAGPASRVLTAA